ncbi:MAG: hypothetical protein ABI813_04185 [Bacteroidota bacterium]
MNHFLDQCFSTLLICTIVVPVDSNSQLDATPVVKDFLPVIDTPQLSGFIGEKLDACYQNRIQRQDAERLVQPFLNRTEASCWRSEFGDK